MRLEGKVAAITGAGRGIGLAAARLFSGEGAAVYILEVNDEIGLAAERSVNEQGGKAKFIKTDITKPEDVIAAFARIDREQGGLDILYNNASIFLGRKDTRVSNLEPDIWKRILEVNLNGLFYCSKYAIPLLRKKGGGSIINTGSSCGVIGVPDCDAYTATKGATISITRSMAVEYGPEKIRVNCIAPAAILTEMVKESDLDNPDFDEKYFLQKGTPLRRWGYPEDIANAALFLASDESCYINGATIVADGGITIS